MIKVQNKRIRTDYQRIQGDKYQPTVSSSEDSRTEALRRFIVLGDRIVEVTETKVVTHGVFMDCDDTMTFEGSAEEMADLVKVAATFAKVQEEDRFIGDCAAHSENLLGEKSGNPLYLSLALPIIHQQVTVKSAMLCLMGFSAEAMEKYSVLKVKDIVAAYMLAIENKISFEDSISLAC